MTTFHLLNFGCRSSQADGAALKRQLLEVGFEEAASAETSELAILNTCTVTAAADAELRHMVRRIHRHNPRCRILVTGCYAQREPEEVARLEGVTWVVGNSHKHLVSALLTGSRDGEVGRSGERVIGSSARQIIEAQEDAPISSASDLRIVRSSDPVVLVGPITDEFHFAPAFPDDRTRPTLKIQDGCNARCSFCVIPSVRGRSRSLAPEIVLDQARRLEAAGYREIVLSGINLGGYGRDLGRTLNLLDIVERLLEATAEVRFRLSSVEPMDITPALVRLVASDARLARHFHIPLQSGCDRILRLMNRRYWARQYAERVLAIHEQIPGCGLGADVMTGFPGETPQDHAASLHFIESLPFTYLHIFPFSARPGTPAARAAGQVEGRVRRERSQEIRAVIGEKRRAFLAAQVGRRLPAVTLDELEDGARIALTTNYLKVALPGDNVSPSRLIDVWVGRAGRDILYGCTRGAAPAPVIPLGANSKAAAL